MEVDESPTVICKQQACTWKESNYHVVLYHVVVLVEVYRRAAV